MKKINNKATKIANKLRVGVVGATGFTGEELVRILSRHPNAEVTYVSSSEDRALKIQDIFPYLKKALDLKCNAFSADEAIEKTDVIFLALPHTHSMQNVPKLLQAGKKIIDVSADYRLQDVKVFEKFYKTPHTDAENLRQAVYGLPELNREEIKSAKLIANPGCYPTGAILGILPGLKKGVFDEASIHIDAKSGVTGAGRKAEKTLNFSEVNESVKAYKLFEHQHVPEIDQALSGVSGKSVSVVFVPHLIPINRGILSTIYVKLAKKTSDEELLSIYKKFYANEPFVKVYDAGRLPEIKNVAHTNFCDIGLKVNEEKNLAVIITAIDNLQKGAAGQAVQNLNIMCGFEETAGL
ncbi:MAG: N-acetyl-gamma-glutamyl-phosphate reductase [Candidatus Kaiserbacteria bacterium GW2011_GWA2_49_19]|uniref:N-acetyl-gamma-glutamyl-phosphate reductase n=1 Tax=Candidatus Kaiserbacteria bacterium GW2011_GWA2_49_19 TaxID=1618669 RepID=A0A0G1VPU6_9BACT|nr:MAG: N-acetyl-gamma-glutamyl-phosphate reductase [Candidatus Kaiserbacteria bacterium GW2011_GWA2_49_19]